MPIKLSGITKQVLKKDRALEEAQKQKEQRNENEDLLAEDFNNRGYQEKDAHVIVTAEMQRALRKKKLAELQKK